MSASKRKASQLDSSSDVDAVAVTEDIDMTGPAENQPESSHMPSSAPPLPESSQAAQAPLSSQNLHNLLSSQNQASSESDNTHRTEKSLGLFSTTEKSDWRRFTGPHEFGDFYGWSKEDKDRLANFFDDALQGANNLSFSQFLVEFSQSEMLRTRNLLTAQQRQVIRWGDLPLDEHINTDHDLCDNLVVTWGEIRKDISRINLENRDICAKILHRLIPATRRPPRGVASVPQLAFQQDELAVSGGQYSSDHVLGKVLEYCRSYDPKRHLAPYTSLVGPSGIGKSFSVSQLAIKHGVYVVYVNLAPAAYQGYPKRSSIADKIPSYEDTVERDARDRLTLFWESLIWVGLIHTAICQKLGISPRSFFILQSMPTYSSFQDDFSTAVVGLHQELLEYKQMKPVKGQSRTNYRDEALVSVATKSEKVLTEWAEALKANDHYFKQHTVTDWPEVLLCIDEGRALLDSSGSLQFRAWREALRQRFSRTAKKYTDPAASSSRGRCFGVILDTSSKIVDFSPPARHDPSQKNLLTAEETTTRDLFAPIYAIETMDLCANPSEQSFPDGTRPAVSHLWNFGRPLWGSRLRNDDPSDNVENAGNLAMKKISGQTSSQRLALLSYRLNFYVNSHTLAEDLVSNWLRYIAYINQPRDVMRTTQPSEPILAHTAAQLMCSPKVRLSVLQQFMRSSFEGSINSGDLGEMVSTIVLMFAFDEVLFQRAGNPWPVAISLGDFMASLLGAEASSSMHKCVNTDKVMKSIWETGYIFFNHFQRLQKTPTEEILKTAFDRGCGLLLPLNFPGIDIILPIHYAGGSMSFFAISVKNRKGDSWTQTLRNETTSSFRKAASELHLSLPFIGLTMALRGPESRFDLLHPSVSTSRGLRSRKKVGIGASSSTSTPATTASADPEPDGQQYTWPGQTAQKHVVGLATGLDESLYPAVNQCQGLKSEESQQIPRLLRELLDCNAGVSLPNDAEMRYVAKLQAVEWKPGHGLGQETEF
ncbi:hypothetical protein FQN54_001495 [Arachnomyces sp. PD_36]|nr:hypothetical protein FQN54_001495 [Arachnomyces sp. PD_36]